MIENETVQKSPALINCVKKVEPLIIEHLASKQEYRLKVWEYLEKNRLTKFPRPVYGRIPNFVGSDEAAKQLEKLDVFKNCQNIEVNPDKPQESARIIALENNKNLYVPVPRLKEGLLKHIQVPKDENFDKNNLKQLINMKGIQESGKVVGLDDEVKIDFFVLGSVAVSKEGYRIGKGRGFADLEYAILLEMGAIHKDTVIATIVHDGQVFESMPKDIFQPYDVPVDYIITPTQVIKVQMQLPRPTGIHWNLISNRRVELMPILKALKDLHSSQGKAVVLKEEDTDVESSEPKQYFRRNPRFTRRPRPRNDSRGSEGRNNETGAGDAATNRRYHGRRFFRRRLPPHTAENTENTENNDNRPPRRMFRKHRPKIDFSLEVRNIEKTVRVRDLKNALNEHGIKPNEITWRGYKGFCFLHYAKPVLPNQGSDSATECPSPIQVDNVIEILQSMKLKPESEGNLMVKIMEPISRIETTDVTAV